MLAKLFLGMSLVGAEWVLYFLLGLSVLSIALILERVRFYSVASRGLSDFRGKVRAYSASEKWDEAARAAENRAKEQRKSSARDLEAEMALAILSQGGSGKASPEVLTEIAQDSVIRAKIGWEQNLSILATIGSNAPFVGLFGTVLGIIKAFHDLSQQAGAGVQGVTSGISEALVATAIGLFVAIPAVVAFNLFQRKVKSAVAEAEALKSYLIGRLAKH